MNITKAEENTIQTTKEMKKEEKIRHSKLECLTLKVLRRKWKLDCHIFKTEKENGS